MLGRSNIEVPNADNRYCARLNCVQQVYNVGYRKRDRREKPEDHWEKPLTEQIVPVQRPAILQSRGDSLPTEGEEDQLPCDFSARVACMKLIV